MLPETLGNEEPPSQGHSAGITAGTVNESSVTPSFPVYWLDLSVSRLGWTVDDEDILFFEGQGHNSKLPLKCLQLAGRCAAVSKR
jgi:hypothetical protein